MPGFPHEIAVEIFQNEPKLVLKLLAHVGANPDLGHLAAVSLADSNLSDRDPEKIKNMFADNVFVFRGSRRTIAVVAEVQTSDPTHDGRMFALAAIRLASPSRLERYTRYLKRLAPPQAQRALEDLMETVWKDDFVDGWLDQGRLMGVKEKLLRLLEKRLSMSEEARERVEKCSDITTIDAWFDRAITAETLTEVFAKLQPSDTPRGPLGQARHTRAWYPQCYRHRARIGSPWVAHLATTEGAPEPRIENPLPSGVIAIVREASANRTCEIAMTRATGKPYRHILELLEEATRP